MTTPSRFSVQPLAGGAPLRTLLFVLLLLGWPALLRAAPLVTATYLPPTDREVAVELSIGQPPPPTLIVIQRLPPEVAVAASEPAATGGKGKNGEIKWLLREVRAGRLVLRLTLDRAVAGGEVSGEVRYRDPVSGEMVTLTIARP